MNKKRKIAAIIHLIVATVYLFLYVFYLKGSELDTLFFIIAIVLISVALFYTGVIFVDQRLLEQTTKLRDELTTYKSLNTALENNNEYVSKDLPIGIIVYNENYIITYSNKEANKLFETNVFQKKLENINNYLYEQISKNKNDIIVEIYGKKYKALVKYETKTIYFVDVTKENTLNSLYDDNKVAIMLLTVDNLDTIDNLSITKRSDTLTKYYQVIAKWTLDYNVYSLSEIDAEYQYFIVKEKDLNRIINDRFNVIERINEISNNEGLNISVSVGVGKGNDNYKVIGKYAEEALELAKSRGGAQAVIYDGNDRLYFGGNLLSNEKKEKTTVKAFYNSLVKEIKNSSSVIVVPHKNADSDAFGSALGVVELCNALGTPAKVVFSVNDADSTVRKIIQEAKNEFIKLANYLVLKENVESLMTGKTLVIAVDHHKKELSNLDIYSKADKVAIIDHHRINESVDIKSNLNYIDHMGSSTVELVCNLLSMCDKNVNIAPFVATIMYTGMVVDTSNFELHVTDDSFAACSLLVKAGADTLKSKLFLRESIEEQIKRLKLLENAKIIDNRFAVLTIDEVVERDFLAKTADDLLNIEDITASFVIGKISKDEVGVSGRSDLTFNVFREMEKLGGGGHFNKGAAQLKGRTIEDVKDELIINIKNTIKGDGDTMKVILIEDVKKQGKKGDVIECTPGYANFLLSKKWAVEANVSNMNALNEEKSRTAKLEQEELEVALKTKEILDKTTVSIYVKVGDGGKFFGSVNSKQISDALKEQASIDVDKRKISFKDDKINSLGTYKCYVKLHKEVTANLSFDVKASKEA